MTEKPLGFGYQFAAGAIAGVSEVRGKELSKTANALADNNRVDSHNVSVAHRKSCTITGLPILTFVFRYPLDVIKTRV